MHYLGFKLSKLLEPQIAWNNETFPSLSANITLSKQVTWLRFLLVNQLSHFYYVLFVSSAVIQTAFLQGKTYWLIIHHAHLRLKLLPAQVLWCNT